jgi:hypothetical protein
VFVGGAWVIGIVRKYFMLLRPNNNGEMAEGMARNGVMARGMAKWVKWRDQWEWREWQEWGEWWNGRMAEWGMVQWREWRE